MINPIIQQIDTEWLKSHLLPDKKRELAAAQLTVDRCKLTIAEIEYELHLRELTSL